jgi:hypothetical protein
VHSDDRVSLEGLLVVDLVVALLEEVVLVGVVVLEECKLALGSLLAKEGARMADHFFAEVLFAHDEDLSESIGRNKVVLDELLEVKIRVFAFELVDLHDREDLTILDEEVPERRNRNTR